MSDSVQDRLAHLTESQRQAILLRDDNLLISAAAGSGKTTVLAERCASLVCDPPAERRCGVEELLVVTFTEAAAAEMRKRIEKAIRQRLRENPEDEHLRAQLYLIDGAQISTIHSFCRAIIRRWFVQAGVDPQAAILNGEEAELLRRETLDTLFVELYGRQDALADGFRHWIEDYSAGNDSKLAEILLALHEYLCSLPDPQAWLTDARRHFDESQSESLIHNVARVQGDRLGKQLAELIDYTEVNEQAIRRLYPVASCRADDLAEFAARLSCWQKQLASGAEADYDKTIMEMQAYSWKRAASASTNADEETKGLYKRALDIRNSVRDIFNKKFVPEVCAFSLNDYRKNLRQVGPYVDTLIELVEEFGRRYRQAKDGQAVMDFNDLQRYAYDLLCEDGDPTKPSEIALQLRQQYRYVLVDEFQDIDPLQESILRLVSRADDETMAGNLFTVGDIKQSIYRFRLAEPKLFAGLARAYKESPAAGKLIYLQENFRSRGEILDAVNVIFETLMSEDFGGTDYDERARLYHGLSYPESPEMVFGRPAVELHILDKNISGGNGINDDEDNEADEDSSREEIDLDGPQREAYLIARRLREWMGLDGGQRRYIADKGPSGGLSYRPMEYRDAVILLRSLPRKADPMAEVLRRMGIPVTVTRGLDSLESTEMNDCLSLLRVLDNMQQDIPLAAVLRGPMLGDALNEGELLDIRQADRRGSFYEALCRYLQCGQDQGLRDRLEVIINKLNIYRQWMQRRPIAEVFWEILEANQYFEFIAGLPEGTRRRDVVIRMHEMMRQFSHFSRQGLRRFVRFCEEMLQRKQWTPVPGGSDEENAVRIMTVHNSKGLEFPVVILADLSKKFNLSDIRGNVLIDRQWGIAPQAADAEQRVYYPTLIHQLAAEQGMRETKAEELRVLYVALTRAREHLLLVGRCDLKKVDAMREVGVSMSRRELESANNFLDWLMPTICTQGPSVTAWQEDGEYSGQALFHVHQYTDEEMSGWAIPSLSSGDRNVELARLAELQPLPDDEPLSPDPRVDELLDRLDCSYESLELTSVPARVSVSELKRRWSAQVDPDERPTSLLQRRDRPNAPVFMDSTQEADAAARGTATHRFLQLIDLRQACDMTDLSGQLDDLIAGRYLSAAESAMIDLEAAAWFFDTELGRRVRSAAAQVQRETTFISRIMPQEYDPVVQQRDAQDVMLIRGMVDLMLPADGGWEIVDYKTDTVSAEACVRRAEEYRTQMELYARAVRAIYRQPVTHCWLVFLHARQVIQLEPAVD